MSARCTVCTHKKREEIDHFLVGDAESLRKLAKQYHLSTTSLHRHKTKHLPAVLAEGKAAQEVGFANDLLSKLDLLEEEAHSIKRSARRAKNLNVAISAIREIRGIIETYAKISGQLKEHKVELNLTLQFANSNVMKVYGAAFPGPAEALKVLLQKEYDGIPILGHARSGEGELFHS
jgi:hypothetical protein